MNIAIALFAVVVVSWGINWVVMKVIVAQVSPLWAVAIRTSVAVVVLAPILMVTGRFIVPQRGDWPIVLVISLFHMVAFAALMAAGLKYIPVGRSMVLGYTTPLWVAPAAWLLLKEPMPARRVAGVLIGLIGLFLLFNPASFDWHNSDALLGNGLLFCSALCWSVSILYTRVHRWISTPFQLVFWQVLLATVALTILASIFEGAPHVTWTINLACAFGFSGIVGTVVAYWAMAIVNSRVTATITSLGVLATPVLGIAISAIALGEKIDTILLVSTALIISGIAIGTTADTGKRAATPAPSLGEAERGRAE